VQSGKARHLGFSESTPEQIQAAAGPELFVSSQPQYQPGTPPPGDSRAATAMNVSMDIVMSDQALEAVQRARAAGAARALAERQALISPCGLRTYFLAAPESKSL
jgi:hypothetical protein